MDESVLTKTKRFFRKNDILFKIILLLFLAAIVAYAFTLGNALLRILASLSLGVMIVSFLSHYISNYLYGDAFKLADAINELVFLFLGIPISIVAIGYLPLSIYILFFSTEDNSWIFPILLSIMITMQVSSFIYILTKRGKEQGQTIFQFIKYQFDFKAKAEERRKFQEQTDQIDIFYSDMEKVRDHVEDTMAKSTVGFDAFDWKEGRGIKREERIEIVCWNCRTLNSSNSLVCVKCGVSLKKDE